MYLLGGPWNNKSSKSCSRRQRTERNRSSHFQGAVISLKCNYDPVTQTSTSGILPSDSCLTAQLWNANRPHFFPAHGRTGKGWYRGIANLFAPRVQGHPLGAHPHSSKEMSIPNPTQQRPGENTWNQWFANHQEVGQLHQRSVLALCLSVLAQKMNSRPGA